jgi:hypothetical protein
MALWCICILVVRTIHHRIMPMSPLQTVVAYYYGLLYLNIMFLQCNVIIVIFFACSKRYQIFLKSRNTVKDEGLSPSSSKYPTLHPFSFRWYIHRLGGGGSFQETPTIVGGLFPILLDHWQIWDLERSRLLLFQLFGVVLGIYIFN